MPFGICPIKEKSKRGLCINSLGKSELLDKKRYNQKYPNKGKRGYKINQKPQKGIPKVTSYKPIEYDGVIYQSIKEAVEKSGRSYYIVTTNGTRIQP